MSVNKLERLLNLLAVLLETTRPLTADELRQKVEGYPPPGPAFHRTFERDKDDLRVLGVPLRVERVPATDPPIDGYRVAASDYYLPDPGLEPDELAALHLASLAVRMEGLDDREALWKLGGGGDSVDGLGTFGGEPSAAQDGLADRSDLGLRQGAVTNIPTDPALEPLFQAIAEGQTITFGYRTGGAGSEPVPRVVEPWRLDFQRGRWYLTGWDRDRQDDRNFRLDRIDGSVDQIGERIKTTPAGASVQGPRPAWEIGDEQPTMARLLVEASRVEVAARQLGPNVSSEPGPDGSTIFTVPVARYDSFRDFVLGFLDHAELLEPVAWRQDLVAWLQTMAIPAETQGSS